MVTNLVIFVAFAVYCLYGTIYRKIKFTRSYGDLLFIGKVDDFKYLPTSVIFRVGLSAVLVAVMVGFFKENLTFLIALALVWVMASLFQLIEMRKSWKKIYLYRQGILVGDTEYTCDYSMKRQRDRDGHYRIGFNDKVYDVQITGIIHGSLEAKDRGEKLGPSV